MLDAQASPPRSGAILFVLCLAVLVAQVDTSVVNLAVHAIGVGLHAPIDSLQWVVDGYNLSYAALLMTGGTWACARRRNSEPPCRPNNEPGMGAGLMVSGSG